ncbi:MAG: hypothetical protein AABZ01_08585 [Gemmatimonadota bacterium]
MDSIPTNIAPVLDLLAETLVTVESPGVHLDYGVALFPRNGRFDAPVFGVVTCGGESTTLTYRMLQGLTEQPVWISGRMIAMIREAQSFGARGSTPTGLLDQPVLHIALTCWAGPTRADMERTAGIESTIYAGDMKAPLILLTPHRLAGWPR